MFLKPFEINRKALVADIVAQDYRTADVFRRHGIGYCCGGKWPMDIACEMQGVDAGKVQAELEMAIRIIQVPGQVDFAVWDIDFLLDYLINVHHCYLRNSLPGTRQLLADFAEEHRIKFPYVTELEKQFDLLAGQLMPSVQQEEEVIFPYIRQIAHAHRNKESYAATGRTLRKPVEQTMFRGHQAVSNIILTIRKLTNILPRKCMHQSQ
jgi:regulator of cell morphogenesis and NO signaling